MSHPRSHWGCFPTLLCRGFRGAEAGGAAGNPFREGAECTDFGRQQVGASVPGTLPLSRRASRAFRRTLAFEKDPRFRVLWDSKEILLPP